MRKMQIADEEEDNVETKREWQLEKSEEVRDCFFKKSKADKQA